MVYFDELPIGVSIKRIKFYRINTNIYLKEDFCHDFDDVRISFNNNRFIKKVDKEMEEQKYYAIDYIETDIRIEKKRGQTIWDIGESLNKIYKIMTKIAVKGRGFCYIKYPIYCEIDGQRYYYDEDMLKMEDRYESGDNWNPNNYIDDLRGLLKEEDYYYFYREARDYTYPIEYRFLNLWKFYEDYYKTRDTNLVKLLAKKHKRIVLFKGAEVETGKRVVRYKSLSYKFYNECYEEYRCAVAHANGKHKGIVPKKENEYSNIMMSYRYLIELANSILKKIIN